MVRLILLDCYQDEPACLGVPPYISPRIRYAAGAARELGLETDYMTIDTLRSYAGPLLKGKDAGPKESTGDELRRSEFRNRFISRTDLTLVVVYAGVVIPGKYLRATPASFREITNIPGTIRKLLGKNGDNVRIVLCGPVARFDLVSSAGKRWETILCQQYDLIAAETPVNVIQNELGDGKGTCRDVTEEADLYGVPGAGIVRRHPDFPDPIICEIETYQGCVRYRSGGCAFCSQSRYGKPRFREQDNIIREMSALAGEGITRFRLGGQSCFYSYGTEELGKSERPRPEPSAVISLLRGIRDTIKNIDVLHIDNVNPAILAEHPVEAGEITRAIVRYCTPGNVAALGLESADPAVYSENNLNSTVEEALAAIDIINRYGRERGENGMPAFLPGINLLGGLKGESPATYQLNFEFLKEVAERDLLLRRINIRGVTAHGYGRAKGRMVAAFRRFRRRVREEIDPVMLSRVVPPGTVLRRVYTEMRDGKTTFGRQVGTYPILVGIPYKVPLGIYIDVALTEHSGRSVTGIETPFPVNRSTLRALSSIPGIGKKRAARIATARPVRGPEDLARALDDERLVGDIEDMTGGIDYTVNDEKKYMSRAR